MIDSHFTITLQHPHRRTRHTSPTLEELGLWQWPGIKGLEKRGEKLGNGNWGVGLALLATLGPP